MTAHLLRRPGWFLLALILITHLPALQAVDFHYDDGHSLVRNPHIRHLANLPRFFVDPALFSENPADAMYRPVVLVAHSISHALSPTSPRAFLFLNLALHIIASLLTLQLLRGLLPIKRALVGASLFALHPLQTEVINYASARSESLAAAGILLALVSFLHYRKTEKGFWLAGLCAGQLLALGSKEIAVITPLLLLLVSFLPGRHKREFERRGLLISAGITSLYLLVYQSFSTPEPYAAELRSMGAQAATQIKAVVYYIRGVLIPVDLSVTPQFSESPSLATPVVLVAAMLLLSAALVLLSSRVQRIGGLGRGLAFGFICLSPTLLVPLNVLVNDHRPYLGLVGIGLVIASLLPTSSGRLATPLKALPLVLMLLCWQRTPDWRTEVSLWESAVREGPRMADAQHNLAFAYHQSGALQQAREHYEHAIALKPDYVRPLTNLGALYRGEGLLDRAEAVLKRAIRSDPEAVEALNNLGLVYAAQRQPELAIGAYQTALQADPRVADIWFNLGLAQRDARQTEDAVQSLQRALQLDPTIRQRQNLGPSAR
jgi:tetratricopeptide (TPR) repeat protein